METQVLEGDGSEVVFLERGQERECEGGFGVVETFRERNACKIPQQLRWRVDWSWGFVGRCHFPISVPF